MKWMVMLLALLMLCCVCTCSLAAFDLKPYMYENGYIVPVSRDTMLIIESSDEEHRVMLAAQGEVLREVVLEEKEDRLNAVIGKDGNIGLITRPDLAGGQAKQQYYRWNADNTLSSPVALSDDAGFLYACGNGFYGAQRRGELYEIFVRDADGREVFSRLYTREGERHISPMDCVRDADGSYLLAISMENLLSDEDTIRIERIDAFGEVIWQAEFAGHYGHYACVLSGDGMGGAYLVKTDDQNYKLAQVYHLGADGSLLWTKRLEAEGLILSPFCGGYDAQAGGLVIKGSVVSKSKGVYKVVSLVVSGDGQVVRASAKDFSSRPDYGFTVERAVDGSVFARSGANYLDTKHTKHVLVPVDALPDAAVPEMTLR